MRTANNRGLFYQTPHEPYYLWFPGLVAAPQIIKRYRKDKVINFVCAFGSTIWLRRLFILTDTETNEETSKIVSRTRCGSADNQTPHKAILNRINRFKVVTRIIQSARIRVIRGIRVLFH